MEWSKKGLETGSFTEETVECITNHLTSFAVVVLDAEVKFTISRYTFDAF